MEVMVEVIFEVLLKCIIILITMEKNSYGVWYLFALEDDDLSKTVIPVLDSY